MVPLKSHTGEFAHHSATHLKESSLGFLPPPFLQPSTETGLRAEEPVVHFIFH